MTPRTLLLHVPKRCLIIATGPVRPDRQLLQELGAFAESDAQSEQITFTGLQAGRKYASEALRPFGLQPRIRSGLSTFTLTRDLFCFLAFLGGELLAAPYIPIADAGVLWRRAFGTGAVRNLRTFFRDYVLRPESLSRRTSARWESGVFRVTGWPTMTEISFAMPVAFVFAEGGPNSGGGAPEVLLRDGKAVGERLMRIADERRSLNLHVEERDKYHGRAIRQPLSKELARLTADRREVITSAVASVRGSYVARHSPRSSDLTRAFAYARRAVELITGSDLRSTDSRDESDERSALVSTAVRHGLASGMTHIERAVLMNAGIELAMQERYAARFDLSYSLMEKLSALYRGWDDCSGGFALAARSKWAYVFISTAAFARRSAELERHLAGYPEERFLGEDGSLVEYFAYWNLDRKVEARIEFHIMLAYHHAGNGEQSMVGVQLSQANALRIDNPHDISEQYQEVLEMTRAQLLTGGARTRSLQALDDRRSRVGLYYSDCHVDACLLDICRRLPDATFLEIVKELDHRGSRTRIMMPRTG